jgi:hypothetical protein
MKLLKVFSISLFVFFSLLLVAPAFAATTPTAKTSPSVAPAPKVFLLATVNISNYKIVSQNDNIFQISFALTNRVGVQTGVKYGIQLVSSTGKNTTIVDEKIYSDSLTLPDDSYISKDIIYEAPKTLSGDYNLFLTSSNESGLTFGIVPLGKVTLKATTQGIEILPSSCFLQVVGEKNEPHYSVTQNIDITKDETLRLTCDSINSANKILSVTPSFETLIGTSYGAVATQTGGSTEAITFKPNEKKTFSVILPVVSTSQFYNVNFKLTDGSMSSNAISVGYFLHGGPIANIRNLSLDKDNYQKGNIVILSLLYNLNQNYLQNGRIKITDNTPPSFVLKASMVNNKNQECISPINQALVQDLKNPILNIPVYATRDCLDPKVSVSILDDKGNVLDQKDFLVKSTQFLPSMITTNKTSQMLIIYLLIGILVVIGIAFYFKNLKKKQNEKTDTK